MRFPRATRERIALVLSISEIDRVRALTGRDRFRGAMTSTFEMVDAVLPPQLRGSGWKPASPRNTAAGDEDSSARPELTVPSIAEPGHDDALLAELIVDGCGDDSDGMT
ncbi:YagE family protein [Rhodococcus sp. AW25M09]|nr:YagE family protein [Rhodococcus sp. AW25M09]